MLRPPADGKRLTAEGLNALLEIKGFMKRLILYYCTNACNIVAIVNMPPWNLSFCSADHSAPVIMEDISERLLLTPT